MATPKRLARSAKVRRAPAKAKKRKVMSTLDAQTKLFMLSVNDKQVARASAHAILLAFMRAHDGDCRLIADAFIDARDRLGF